ncbi:MULTISPECIES: hypothetical protein [Arthrobacter]|uniref:DUF4352 domain-containing protein n=1 Tax=Arthrobacter oryzae TaxID=409290 RepID=A0A3N0BTF9_9MICC|nr:MULTISPECIES: hypothetical protein [Arthrobacter]QYF90078.1 hypothetical protein KY499_01510 [Arthrobacter sp. PAMC25284]RNL52025.1 hypothetical protein D7003_13895 [Arthrobacter oryzae]
MPQPAAYKRTKIVVPAILLILLAGLMAAVLTAPPRKPPVPLGASATVNGGLARVNGILPFDNGVGGPDGVASRFPNPPGPGLHRVRILLELTALDKGGLSYHPDDYSVSGLGTGRWTPVWFSPAPSLAAQGERINAELMFELPDRAVELTLEVTGGPGLSLGVGHHRTRG